MSMNRLTEIADKAQEKLTQYTGVINSDHAYIHKGLAYTAIINTGSISAAYDIAFTTPTIASGKFIHWRPVTIVTSADFVSFNLYEGDSFSAGTAVVPINRNRNLTTEVSKMQTFVKGATATPAGTIIASSGVGTAGATAAQSGGSIGAEQELVLLPDTNYVLTLDPDGATTCILELFWYEEDGYKAD